MHRQLRVIIDNIYFINAHQNFINAYEIAFKDRKISKVKM